MTSVDEQIGPGQAGNGAAARYMKAGENGTTSSAGAKAPRPRTPAHMLGEIVALMGQSPAHKHMFLSDLEWLVSPAMLHGQLRIIYSNEQAVAVAIWASVSEQVDQELRQGRTRLRPDEWKSGDQLWLIELVAPPFMNDADQAKKLLSGIASEVFGGKPFKMLRLNPETRIPEMVEVSSNSMAKRNAGMNGKG